MYCTQCGSEIGPNARFCGSCGHPVSAGDSKPALQPASRAVIFPGGIRRSLALLTDLCLLLLFYGLTSLLFILAMESLPAEHPLIRWIESSNNFLYLVTLQWLLLLCYFPWFDSRHAKGSPGKRLLGITLLTTRDQPPSIVRSGARFFSSLFPGLLLFPFTLLQAVFTRDKRMLHDRLTGTVLVRGTRLDHASYATAALGERRFGWWLGLLLALLLGAAWLSWLGGWFLDTEAGRSTMITLGLQAPDEPLLTGNVWRASP